MWGLAGAGVLGVVAWRSSSGHSRRGLAGEPGPVALALVKPAADQVRCRGPDRGPRISPRAWDRQVPRAPIPAIWAARLHLVGRRFDAEPAATGPGSPEVGGNPGRRRRAVRGLVEADDLLVVRDGHARRVLAACRRPALRRDAMVEDALRQVRRQPPAQPGHGIAWSSHDSTAAAQHTSERSASQEGRRFSQELVVQPAIDVLARPLRLGPLAGIQRRLRRLTQPLPLQRHTAAQQLATGT